MSLPYFYEKNIAFSSNLFRVSEDTSKHCIQVLRMKKDEQLQLTDGRGNLYTASIQKEDKKHCEVRIEEKIFEEQLSRKISVGISLLKNTSRFEWFLEKAAEIGISEIIPIICSRTERQHFRLERMNNILVAAMLQSRQTWLPQLPEPIAFETVITASPHQQKLIAHCMDKKKTALKDLMIDNDVIVLIGPEGDFTTAEVQIALTKGFEPITLGQTRLRTETGAIVASTLLMNL